MAKERIVFEVDFDLGDARKNVIAYEKSLLELKQAQKDLDASFKAGELSTEGYASAMFDLKAKTTETKNAQKEYQRQIDLTTKANVANAGSYQQITANLALESAELRKLAGTLKLQSDGTFQVNRVYDAQFEKVKKLKDAQLAFDSAIKDGRTNVGNYKEALEETNQELRKIGASLEVISGVLDVVNKAFLAFYNTLNLVGVNLVTLILGLFGVKGGILGLIKSLFSLRGAIIATGIGALIVAFGSLLSFINSTEEGGNKFAQLLARFKPLTDAVVSTFQTLGKVIFGVIESIGKVFSFVSDNIFGTTSERAAQLVKDLQEVNKAQLLQETRNKESLATQSKLKEARDDASKSFDDQVKASKELQKEQRKNFDEQSAIANKRLQIAKEELERTPIIKQTLEQVKNVELERQKVLELTNTLYEQQRENQQKLVKIAQSLVALQIENNTALLEQDILTGKIASGSLEEVNSRKKLLSQNLDNQLKSFDEEGKLQKLSRDERLKVLAETDEKARNLILKSKNSELELDKGFQEKQAEQYQDYLDKVQEQREANLENQLAGFELEVEKTTQGTVERIEAEKRLLVAQSQVRVETEKLTNNALLLEKEQLKNALIEKDKEITTLGLNETQLRLEREAQLDVENSAKQIALLQFQSNRRITEEKLTGEALKSEVALTEKAISDIRKAEIEKQKNQSTEKIQNESQKLQTLVDLQKFAIEQDTATQAEKDLRLLELRKTYLADLQLAEQSALEAQFQFDLEFTAKTEAEKQALQIAYAQQSLDIERKYADDSKQITESLKQADLARLETAQGIFGSLAGLFEEQTIAYKAFATVEAVIATYLAANKALASAPPPIGTILAGIAVAQGLINVAKINGLKFAKGGVFGGKPHSAGGTKGYFEDGTMVEVEKGEAWAVVNKKNTPMLKTLSAVNSFGGNGKSYFQQGGVVGADVLRIGQDFLSTTTANEAIIRSMPPQYLRVTDLFEVENNVAITERITNQ